MFIIGNESFCIQNCRISPENEKSRANELPQLLNGDVENAHRCAWVRIKRNTARVNPKICRILSGNNMMYFVFFKTNGPAIESHILI